MEQTRSRLALFLINPFVSESFLAWRMPPLSQNICLELWDGKKLRRGNDVLTPKWNLSPGHSWYETDGQQIEQVCIPMRGAPWQDDRKQSRFGQNLEDLTRTGWPPNNSPTKKKCVPIRRHFQLWTQKKKSKSGGQQWAARYFLTRGPGFSLVHRKYLWSHVNWSLVVPK